MAEYCLVRVDQLIPVPEDAPLDVMALTGCGVLTGIGTVLNPARTAPAESILVIGCGGVNVMQACNLVGAHPIIAIDTKPKRLALAAEFGASNSILGAEGFEIPTAVREVVFGDVHWPYEVVGIPHLVRQADDAMRALRYELGRWRLPRRFDDRAGGRGRDGQSEACRRLPHAGGLAARDIPRIIDLYRCHRIKLNEPVGARIGFTSALRRLMSPVPVRSVPRSVACPRP